MNFCFRMRHFLKRPMGIDDKPKVAAQFMYLQMMCEPMHTRSQRQNDVE